MIWRFHIHPEHIHGYGTWISEIQLPTYCCNTYYICTCRWHSYFRYSATNIFLHIELILMPQNFDALEVLHFPRTFTRASGLLFADIPHISRTCITLISDISDLQLPFTCSCLNDAPDVPHFSRTFAGTPGLCFSDIPDTPRTSITCGIFILDTSNNQHPI